MKAGDLVTLKNLPDAWGKVALVTRIHVTSSGTGQICMIARDMPRCTIPYARRAYYIEDELGISYDKGR